MQFKRVLNSRLTAVAAGAAVLAVAAGGVGYAAGQIDSRDVKNESLTGADIKNGSLAGKELTKSLKRNLRGSQGPAGEDGAALEGSFTSTAPTSIDTGGSFTARATQLGTIELPAGTYVINGYGFFDTVDNTTARGTEPRLQLALRGPATAGNSFGADYGTCFTGEFAAAPADREATCTTVRTVRLTEQTTIRVMAFGYHGDQGATDDVFNAVADVSALKVA